MGAAVIQQWVLAFGLGILGVQFGRGQTPLISSGSVWKYLDDGSDQGVAWRNLVFDDLTWASGPAQLGYGDGDEATVVNGGPATNRFITTYFRQTFAVIDPLSYTNLAVRLLRDDGGVVYLNGAEIFRSNMPTNDIGYDTLASGPASPADESTTFYANAVDPALLLPGLNVMAVEIHQFSPTSSDISFDLAFIGNFAETPPTVAITSPGNSSTLLSANVTITAEAHDNDDAISLVEFFQGDTKLGDTSWPPYTLVWSNPLPGNYTLTAVATDSHALSTTSAPVNI